MASTRRSATRRATSTASRSGRRSRRPGSDFLKGPSGSLQPVHRFIRKGVSRTPTASQHPTEGAKMSIMIASALAGAVALNLPILIAGTALPLTTLVTAGVVLALLGAKLGWLIGWSFAGSRHD